jgi:hypothetical protein
MFRTGCDVKTIKGWSAIFDERYIVEPGQLAVLQSCIFNSRESAEKHYLTQGRGMPFTIVHVTIKPAP